MSTACSQFYMCFCYCFDFAVSFLFSSFIFINSVYCLLRYVACYYLITLCIYFQFIFLVILVSWCMLIVSCFLPTELAHVCLISSVFLLHPFIKTFMHLYAGFLFWDITKVKQKTSVATKQQVIHIDTNNGIFTHCNILVLLLEKNALKVTSLNVNTGTAAMTK